MGRVIAKGAGGRVETLPPPGDARREVLAERSDALVEAAESQGIERERIDPAKLRVELELAQHFNELEVANALPDKAYCWVQSGFYGRFIKMKLAEGWEVVQGDMPEAESLKGMGADTTRRLGDVILMRIGKGRYEALRARERAKAEARDAMIPGPVEELAREAGVQVYTQQTMDPRNLKRIQSRAEGQRRATQITDKWLREGRMPGAPAPSA